MLKHIIGVVMFALSHVLLAQTSPAEHSDILQKEQAVSTVQNIAYALKHIYLHPKKAAYPAESLVSESFTDLYQNGIDKEEFLSSLRSKLIRGTSDTSIDIGEVESLVQYSETGEPIFVNSNGSVNVKRLEQNIGYLKIKGHATSPEIKSSILEGFRSLLEQKGLILDLRLADTADLDFIIDLASLFVPEGESLGKLETRDQHTVLKANNTAEYEAFKQNFPLYIVQSSFVSGEWEFFAYALQHLEKATIVGVESMGVNQLSKSILVGNNIALSLPYAKLTHPSNNNSWDQEGVVPDYFSPAEQALSEALKLAQQRINKK